MPPKVGVGVLIVNQYNELLLGQRLNTHGAESWSIPGGHLEYGESFTDCARREILEETGLTIADIYYCATTNDIFHDKHLHYVSIFMIARQPDDQIIVNNEPHKTREWKYFDLEFLPNNLFLPLNNLIKTKSLFVLKNILNHPC